MTKFKTLNYDQDAIRSCLIHSFTWKIGEWREVNGGLTLCHNGLHCSNVPTDTWANVHGNVLALVSTDGDYVNGEDKQVWRRMRIDVAYKVTREWAVALMLHFRDDFLRTLGKYAKVNGYYDAANKLEEMRKAASISSYSANTAYMGKHEYDQHARTVFWIENYVAGLNMPLRAEVSSVLRALTIELDLIKDSYDTISSSLWDTKKEEFNDFIINSLVGLEKINA